MQDLKTKIKAVMLEHLQSKGYPELTSSQILSELKPMWLKLEEANLIQQGWSFPQFKLIAMQMAEQDQIFRILRGDP